MLRVRPSHSLLQERLKTQTWRWGQINPKTAESHFPQHPENLLLTAKAPLPSSQRRRRHLQVVAVVDGADIGDLCFLSLICLFIHGSCQQQQETKAQQLSQVKRLLVGHTTYTLCHSGRAISPGNSNMVLVPGLPPAFPLYPIVE